MMNSRQMVVAGLMFAGLGFALGSGIALPTPGPIDGPGPGNCGDIPPSQELSEPCCPDHGVDACGALLFCAAFDGRSQHTCYPERSRADMTECDDDLHCVSGGCNQPKRLCESSPSSSCDGAIGCAPDEQSRRYVCAPEDDVCRRIGDGNYGDLCLNDADCTDDCDEETKRCVRSAGSWPECTGQEPEVCQDFGLQHCIDFGDRDLCTIYCHGDLNNCIDAGLVGACCSKDFCVLQEYCD